MALHSRHGVSNHQQLDCLPISSLRLTSMETPKVRITDPFLRGIQEWIPLTKGQWCRKSFHIIYLVFARKILPILYSRSIHPKRHARRLFCFALSFYHQSKNAYYSDVIMIAMASLITGLTIVYSTVYSGADQRKHQSSASLAFAREIHRWPVNSPLKGPVTRKMFPFDDVIMSVVSLGQSYDMNKVTQC